MLSEATDSESKAIRFFCLFIKQTTCSFIKQISVTLSWRVKRVETDSVTDWLSVGFWCDFALKVISPADLALLQIRCSLRLPTGAD